MTIVGLGSIGSAAASALARDGIRRFALVDHDRLLEHNVIRHELTLADLGRLKVEALTTQLRSRYEGLDIERFPVDAVEQADVMRPLFARSSVVLCATDGVAPRRVVNHLARRAGVPAVLACVLGDGAIGEVIRVQPGVGCLTCLRMNLRDRGSMDLEPTIDREYGTGTTHLPMTAVPGDLRLVAELAAKVTVGTLMERKGYADQRLPADYAVIGLRPTSVYREPFDVTRAGEVSWHPTGPPRPDCLTCAGT